MTEVPPSTWIHIGECPVCVNGLVRIRTCDGPDGSRHFYAMCDECEALWLKPTTDSAGSFADATHPKCPICELDLYGDQAHWSEADELLGTNWASEAIFDVAAIVPSLEIDGDSLGAAENRNDDETSSGESARDRDSSETSADQERSHDPGADIVDFVVDDDPQPGC